MGAARSKTPVAYEVVTGRGAARILGLSQAHVVTLRKTGKLVPVQRLPKTDLFLRADVEALRREREKNPPRIGRPPKNAQAEDLKRPLRADGRRPKMSK